MSPPVALPLVKFNGGETTVRVRGRSDLDWYSSSLEIELNAVSLPHGPAAMRNGTWHAGVARIPGGGTAGTVRLVSFIAGVDPLEAYVVEFTDQKLRFWQVGPRSLVGGGSPVEVASPYLAADLGSIRTVQSRDVMWIMHPDYRPQTLKRTSPTTFALAPVEFGDGPYYPMNKTGPAITAGGTSGLVSIVSSAPMFAATDVGRFLRITDLATWGHGQITDFHSTTHVSMQVLSTLPTLTPGGSWRLGLWSDTTGWPSCGVFHQERLFYGSNPAGSFARLDGSAQGDFDNFTPGTQDADAVAYVLGAGDLPAVRNLISTDRALIAITSSAELKIGHEQSTQVMTPSNPPIITPISTEGAADAEALRLKRGSIFLQRYFRSIHEIAYAVDSDGLQTRDISVRADHLGSRAPFAGACWQNRPYNLIWVWSRNGALVACTYTPEQSVIAWHRHRMGGRFQGGFAKVESMCSTPGLGSDEVWVCVRRTINGVDVRHIDVFADVLQDNEPQDEAVYLDAAVRVRGTAPAADITFSLVDLEAGTARLTASSSVWSAPDVGKRIHAVLEDLEEEATDGQLLWRRVELEITGYVSGTVVDVRLVSPYVPPSLRIDNGAWRYGITQVTGLGHLEGETVAVMIDGGPSTPTVVTGGAVDLEYEGATVLVGLLYKMIVQPVAIDAGGQAGTTHTRREQIAGVGLELVRSGPFRAGIAGGSMYDVNVRTANDLMNEAVPLLTGTHVIEVGSGEDERRIRWRLEAEGPLPVMISCAAPIRSVGEAVP